MDLVSIIVPVYRVEKYLNRCVDSLLNQTYQNFEIILVDDGSPDDSGKICDEYALKDIRVRVLHIQNGGVSNARNVGLSVANGKYVTFVDSDDFLEDYAIEHLLQILIDNQAECSQISCNMVQVDAKGMIPTSKSETDEQLLVLDKQEALDALMYMHQPFNGFEVTAVWGTLYKKEVLKDIKFVDDMAIGEDFVFKFDVFMNTGKIVISNQKGYNYLIHNNSVMRNGFSTKKLNAIYVLKELIENTDAKAFYYDGLLSRAVNIGFVVLSMIPISKTYKVERTFVKDYIRKYRKRVLFNKKTRLKVKAAVLCSYIGFDITQIILKLIQQ